jgi:23S rRNA (adenine2503-C2)-methyltransferase
MRILKAAGREDIATVYIADFGQGKLVEFVESTQPPLTRDKKWVLIISTLFGCPVKCLMCDAGDDYKGRISKEEMFLQIDYLIRRQFPDGVVPVEKFKIQFARMGEPALNPSVIDVLDEMPLRYYAPGFIPSVSTTAPCSADGFFNRLLELKNRRYPGGRFQLQFSIHTTDEELRHKIIPVEKWTFAMIAEYGESFHEEGDQKIGLNFALACGMPVDAEVLLKHFSPEKFLIKITPINPTHRAAQNELRSYVDAYCDHKEYSVIDELRSSGYNVILNIGEVEENRIGSNCGQYVMQHLRAKGVIEMGYDYWEFRGDYDTG